MSLTISPISSYNVQKRQQSFGIRLDTIEPRLPVDQAASILKFRFGVDASKLSDPAGTLRRMTKAAELKLDPHTATWADINSVWPNRAAGL